MELDPWMKMPPKCVNCGHEDMYHRDWGCCSVRGHTYCYCKDWQAIDSPEAD